MTLQEEVRLHLKAQENYEIHHQEDRKEHERLLCLQVPGTILHSNYPDIKLLSLQYHFRLLQLVKELLQ